jgi:hypothetical protein
VNFLNDKTTKYFVIKFKDECVIGFGKRDLRKGVRWWKKKFLQLEKTKHVQLI